MKVVSISITELILHYMYFDSMFNAQAPSICPPDNKLRKVGKFQNIFLSFTNIKYRYQDCIQVWMHFTL